MHNAGKLGPLQAGKFAALSMLGTRDTGLEERTYAKARA